jgi:hypothetical protein
LKRRKLKKISKMIKILISVPTLNSHIHAELFGRIMQWNATNYIGFMPIMGIQPADEARNRIVEEFLKTDCSHLMMIDADTVPPEDTIDRMLKLNKDVVSGITPMVQGGKFYKYNAVDEDDKEIKPNTGIFRSKGVGSSCILIKREVFSKIKKPYFRFIYQDDTGKETFVSEDIFFCSLLLQAGIDIWIDSDIICKHFKTISFQ